MRLRLLIPLAIVCALALASPAFGLTAQPKLTRAQIGALVDRYVKDLVLRENVADGWTISGPQMRGGTTRKAFLAGNVPVQRLRLVGHSWAHAWVVTSRTPNEFGLDLYLHLGHGQSAQIWDDELVIDRIHGKWLVNALYTKAVTRLGRSHHGSCATSKCQITGLGDFSAGSRGGGDGGPPPTLGGGWAFYLLGGVIAGVPLTTLLGYLLYARTRNRRAWAEYVNTKRA